MLEALSVQLNDFRGPIFPESGTSFPRLRSLCIKIGPNTPVFDLERFPALQQFNSMNCQSADAVLNFSTLCGRDLDLKLFDFSGKINLPVLPLDRLSISAESLQCDDICGALPTMKNLNFQYRTLDDLALLSSKFTGSPPPSEPVNLFALATMQRLQLVGRLSMSHVWLGLFPVLRHLTLYDVQKDSFDGSNFPSLETLSLEGKNGARAKPTGNFAALHSLTLSDLTLTADFDFSAPSLKILSFGRVEAANLATVGTRRFPALQMVRVMHSGETYNPITGAVFFPRFCEEPTPDDRPSLLLMVNPSFAPDWIAYLKISLSCWTIVEECPPVEMSAIGFSRA